MITLIIVSFAFVSQANARLGETMEQCEKRYGEYYDFTTDQKLNGYFYMKNDYKVVAYFIEGVCQRIDYGKENSSGGKEPLGKKEIEVFLSSNAQNSEWVVISDSNWARKDEKAVALYYESEYYFVITTTTWIKDQEQGENTEVEKQLKGF